MAQYDFKFVNSTGEKISFFHQRKNTTGETFHLERGEERITKVAIPSQTFEKYWLLDSTGQLTKKFVSSDDYKSSQQVTVTKTGDTFDFDLVPRNNESAGGVGGLWQRAKNLFKLKGKETQSLPT